MGDVIKIKDNAHVYGTTLYFAPEVYKVPHTITQISGDRVVCENKTYGIEAVSSKDIEPWVEPEPIQEPEPEPKPEPIVIEPPEEKEPGVRYKLFTKEWWIDAAERTIATMAEVAIGLLTAGTIADIDWKMVAVTTGVSGLVAFLKAIVKAA